MATITLSEALSNLEAASKGEDVKSAVIAMFESLSSTDMDVEYLGGQRASHYIETQTIERLKQKISLYFKGYDIEPKSTTNGGSGSVNLIKSGDLYNFLNPMITSLREVAGITKPVETEPGEITYLYTFQDCLTYIYNRVYDSNIGIKKAIESKDSKTTHEHIVIPDTDSVLDYGTWILDIDDHSVDVEPLTITSMDEVHVADENKAFNPITLNYTITSGPLVATLNDTYDPADKGWDAFDSVIVKVPVKNPNSSSSSSSSSSDKNLKLTDLVVTENGEYAASSDGADGYSSVNTENVNNLWIDPNKRFTVKFEVNGEIVQTVPDVAPGESVEYEGNTPVHPYTGDYWIFDGWDPMPIRVYGDITCVAMFTRWTGAPVINGVSKIPGGYRTESWEEIAETGGSQANVGDIKTLYVPNMGYIRMQKVNTSEAGATSVWLSMDAFYSKTNAFPGLYSAKIDDSKPIDWNNWTVRKWLNEDFLNMLPECLQNHIVNMDKIQIVTDGANQNNILLGSSKCKIWIPSITELNFYAPGETIKANGIEFEIRRDANTQVYSPFQYLTGGGSGNLWGKGMARPSRQNGASWNTLMEGIKGTSYTPGEFTLQHKLICVLPHRSDAKYMFYNTDTSTWVEASNFDQLSWDDKLAQYDRYYYYSSGTQYPPSEENPNNYDTIPEFDTKAMYVDYPDELPTISHYSGFGLDAASFVNGGGIISYMFPCQILRDIWPYRSTFWATESPSSGMGSRTSMPIPGFSFPVTGGVSHMGIDANNMPFRIGFGLK